MLYEKKYYGNGAGNFDDADFILQPNQWINLENARIGSTDNGVIGTVESVGSNMLLSTILPSVTFVQIGAVPDPANRRFFYFLKDLYGPWDKIVCYDEEASVFYNVLFSAQVTGGLNFSKDHIIHSGAMVNGLLYWTDFFNQPRRINIEAAINMNHPGTFPDVIAYTSPMTAEAITIIRKPPNYPVAWEKTIDPDIETNQIRNNAFRFTYQYEYRDGEISTLAMHSTLAPYNFKDETFNSITVTIPFDEVPDQDVQRINIIVIYVDGNTGYIVKTWDKANAADAAAIAAHVAQITSLAFNFANDSVGEAISNVALVKPYNVVPLLSEALEQGTNRLFLGRNLIGYDTPVQTSLTVSIVSRTSGEPVSGIWVLVNSDYYIDGEQVFNYLGFFAYFTTPIDDDHPAGLYDFTANPCEEWQAAGSPPVYPSLPTEIDISDYTFLYNPLGEVESSFMHIYINAHFGYPAGTGSGTILYDINFPVDAFPAIADPGSIIIKSGSPYRVGVVFYDQYMRQCGVVTNTNARVTTPDRGYDSPSVYNLGIQWSFAAGPQPIEIPVWAYRYSIVATKSLRTSFFQQARAGDLKYVVKDTDGNYTFTSDTYADFNFGVGLKLDILNGYGMGYSYQAGDIVNVFINGDSNVYRLAVLDQSGDWLIAELADLGNVSAKDAFFEVYTPVSKSAAEIFYEVGQIFNVLDPGTAARRYETLSGFLPGDTYLIQRGLGPTYLTENMSPNDTYWRNWFTDAGRIQIFDRIGAQFKQTSVRWSNTFIPGTITNGLSSFDALDEKLLPGEMGPLRKLQITSKVNNELGAVMLGLCEQETASMYLGEQQLVGSAANAFIAQASEVIGTINILKGSFGTINPESVIEFRGNVYWVDVLNGKVIQYSLSGLFPISNYKMSRYWKLFCDQYLSMTPQQIESLGSRPFIFSTVDPHHWELLITVPKVLPNPPMGYLPDAPYSNYVYPFDIWDGQAKTLVFKINSEPNYWLGSFSWTQEGYVSIQNKLYSFKFGQLYQHNSTTSYCNFNGIQYKSRIMGICNQQPEGIKVYDNIAIEANTTPTLAYFMSLSPYMQVTNLQDFDYENKEDVLYSQLYRNVLTPTATGLVTNALVKGEKMRTYALRFMLEYSVTTAPVELRYVSLGYQLSLGHSIIKQ